MEIPVDERVRQYLETEKEVASQRWMERTTGQSVDAWIKFRGVNGVQLTEATKGVITRPYLSQLRHGKTKFMRDDHMFTLATALNLPWEALATRMMPSDIISDFVADFIRSV